MPDGIRVDGRLDEEIYPTTPPISDFVQQEPDEGQPATEQTEAWVFFDDDHVYVAARCWDTQPDRRVANEMRRDTSQLRQNDTFGVLFDTFHDRRNGYLFYANPIGGLADSQITDEGPPNADWNTVWDVKTATLRRRLDDRDGDPVQVAALPARRATRPGASTCAASSAGRTSGRTSTQVPRALTTFRGILKVSSAGTLVGLQVPSGSTQPRAQAVRARRRDDRPTRVDAARRTTIARRASAATSSTA